jgi:penicillin-binding protein 1A
VIALEPPRPARPARPSRRARSERRPRWRRFSRTALRVSTVLVVGVPLFVLAAGAAGLGLLLYGDLPGTVPEEHERVVSMPTTVVDSRGEPIGSFHEFELTVPIEPEDIPQVLKDAVVAAEDQHFWDHRGVDVEAIARAIVENAREGEVVQGASTITQQLVKNRYLSDERTLERKLDEVIIAARLEREMSKEEILFEYLDTTYFGGGAYGVGAAAQTYFHKHVSELTVSESALLAGLIPAPSEMGPRENPFGAEARRQAVLDNMRELGYLDTAAYDDAMAQQLWLSTLGEPEGPRTVYHPPPEEDIGPYPFFLDYVRRYLVERYGEDEVFRGGLRVETTIDPALQAHAEAAVAAGLEGTAAPLEMSLVSVDPATGHVRALVGGRDWAVSQVNLALGGTLGMQPGSSFKPFVLATAFEHGMTPDTVYPAPSVWQVPGCQGTGCTVQNYNGRGYGAMSLRSATWQSTNTVYAELVNDLGPATVAETARRMGVASLGADEQYGVSLALGAAEVSPLEMASAYGVFAGHGRHSAPTPVLRVLDAEGHVLEDNAGQRGEQVMHPAVADTVTDVLTGVIASGTGTGAALDRPAAGKTGTAEEYRAAWFVGYTPQLSTAVWMGYADEPRPLENIGGYASVTGGTLPASAWAAFMSAAHAGLPVVEFPTPGPLPAPSGETLVVPGGRDFPATPPLSCGGLCDQPPPEPDDEESDEDDDESSGSDDESDDESSGNDDDESDDGDGESSDDGDNQDAGGDGDA